MALGSLMGSMDLAAACKAGRVCNDLGLDTISAGGTIAWAMEAFERGDITVEDIDGAELQWGDMETVINTLLPAIARRQGRLGALLADGSVAAGTVGKDSIKYTAHSKGLEAPMHDPRGGGHGLALTYAVSPRGACHVATPMLFMEMGACYYPEIGFEYELEPMTDKDKPEAAVTAVELGKHREQRVFCQFAWREFDSEWVDLFNVVRVRLGYRRNDAGRPPGLLPQEAHKLPIRGQPQTMTSLRGCWNPRETGSLRESR